MAANDPSFVPLNTVVLTVSDSRTPEDDKSGDLIAQRMQDAGHHIAKRLIHRDDLAGLSVLFRELTQNPDHDTVISTGGTGLTKRDITPEAAAVVIEKSIPGFGELFRMLSYAEIDASTIDSRACAGVANGTLVFVLPGSPGACRLAMDKIVLKQLDARTRPCNLTVLLPRIRSEKAPD